MKSSMQLTGFKELSGALAGLKASVRNKIARPALAAGATPILKDAKSRLSGGHGLLRKSLGRKTTKQKYNENTPYVLIGPRKGFAATIGTVKRGPKKGQPIIENPANIGHLVEFGHGGPHPAPPHPFLRPALSAQKDTAIEIIGQKVFDGLVKELNK